MNFEDIFKEQDEEVKNAILLSIANAQQVTPVLEDASITESGENSTLSCAIDEVVAAISAAATDQDTVQSSVSIVDEEQNTKEIANKKSESQKVKSSKTRSSVQSSPKKGVKKAKCWHDFEEKRGAPFRPKASKKAIERIERVINQRMLLLHREREQGTNDQNTPSSSTSSRMPLENDVISEEFIVTGSTGYVYTVNIDRRPRCNCPDWKKYDGNPCKHTMFVFLRVLGVSKESHLWYQRCLLTNELKEIFANARPDPATSNSTLRSAYLKATYGIKEENKEESNKEVEKRRIPQKGDLCPICYEEFEEGMMDDLIFCQASCGNPLHKKCVIEWAKSMGKPLQDMKCIYCRGLMAKPIIPSKDQLKVTQKGEYMNVGGYRSGFYGER